MSSAKRDFERFVAWLYQSATHTPSEVKQLANLTFGRILGIPAANLVWTYLNKGTHEKANRDDFDANQVETVVQTLEALDGLYLCAGR